MINIRDEMKKIAKDLTDPKYDGFYAVVRELTSLASALESEVFEGRVKVMVSPRFNVRKGQEFRVTLHWKESTPQVLMTAFVPETGFPSVIGTGALEYECPSLESVQTTLSRLLSEPDVIRLARVMRILSSK